MAIRWKMFEKSGGRSGKYNKYSSRVVVITAEKGIILPPATMELLGNPDKVLLLHDGGGHIGLRPVKENDPEYDNAFAIQTPKAKTVSTGKATSFINCKGFLERYNINSKIVFSTVSVENDILVVDLNKFEILKVNN